MRLTYMGKLKPRDEYLTLVKLLRNSVKEGEKVREVPHQGLVGNRFEFPLECMRTHLRQRMAWWRLFLDNLESRESHPMLPYPHNSHHLHHNQLPWERFQDWLHCVAVVAFDLELGQTIEKIYPGDVELSQQERLNLCYMAFPDSNSHCSQDTIYHFRLKKSLDGNFSSPSTCNQLTPPQSRFHQLSPVSRQLDERFLFGFVHFRQERREELPRGYYQKSIVLLSPLPLMGLFTEVVERVALAFFEQGEMAIEKACHQIDQWPPPVPLGQPFTLPLLSAHLSCRLVARTDLPQRQIESQHEAHVAHNIPIALVNTLKALSAQQLHTLWELVLLGEPLLVMGHTPTLCSTMAQLLTSLIWPLKYSMDYRPYFTIHDSDFNELTSTTAAAGGSITLVGVTNPFFTKALKHWPNVLRCSAVDKPSASTAASTPLKGAIKALKASQLPKSHHKSSAAGFTASYKPSLTPTKESKADLGKRLYEVEDPSEAISLLRRHFLELTESFLAPMERYLSSLMPLKRDFDAFKSVPHMRPLLLDEFLVSLQQSTPVPQHGLKGDWPQLYSRFIERSPNFTSWLQQRQQDIGVQLKKQHLEVLCSADFSPQTLSSHGAVEVVDLVLKLKDRLGQLGIGKEGSEEKQKKRLRGQLQRLVESVVDEDLKAVLLSNGGLLRDAFES